MIGKLRQRIIIQQKTDTPDGQGGCDSTWSTFATRWARVKPVSAKERSFAKKLEHNITHIVTIRHLSGVLTNMRVLHDSRILQIHGVLNREERSIWIDLNCEEGVAS